MVETIERTVERLEKEMILEFAELKKQLEQAESIKEVSALIVKIGEHAQKINRIKQDSALPMDKNFIDEHLAEISKTLRTVASKKILKLSLEPK